MKERGNRPLPDAKESIMALAAIAPVVRPSRFTSHDNIVWDTAVNNPGEPVLFSINRESPRYPGLRQSLTRGDQAHARNRFEWEYGFRVTQQTVDGATYVMVTYHPELSKKPFGPMTD